MSRCRQDLAWIRLCRIRPRLSMEWLSGSLQGETLPHTARRACDGRSPALRLRAAGKMDREGRTDEAPSVRAERTVMVPPCRSTISFVTQRPSPVPDVLLGGEERLKDALHVFGGNAGPVVFDHDAESVAHPRSRIHRRKRMVPLGGHCIHGIRNQVGDDLLQLAGHADMRGIRRIRARCGYSWSPACWGRALRPNRPRAQRQSARPR